MTITTYGQRIVAQWCKLTPQAISMWIERYDDWPVPTVEVVTAENERYPARGWSLDRRRDWEEYAARKRGERHKRPKQT